MSTKLKYAFFYISDGLINRVLTTVELYSWYLDPIEHIITSYFNYLLSHSAYGLTSYTPPD